MQRMILLNPGPVNVTERVKMAWNRPEICHRESDFAELLNGIRKKLKVISDVDDQYTVVVLTGSGTASMEAAITSTIRKKALLIKNGVYGDRFEEIISTYNIEKKVLEYPWTEQPDLSEIEKALIDEPDIDTIVMVHIETTTGLVNPIGRVGELSRKYQKVFLVDSVTGIGSEYVDIRKNNIGVCIGTSNKSLQSFPGVSFVVIRKGLLDIMKENKRTVYLNLYENHEFQERGQCPFTPAVQALYTLDVALDELIEEKVEGRIEWYKGLAGYLRQGVKGLGLKLLLPPEYQSNTITSIFLPDKITYEYLHDRFKENGFIIYNGLGNLKKNTFRVCNMGDISRKDIQRFLELLETFIK